MSFPNYNNLCLISLPICFLMLCELYAPRNLLEQENVGTAMFAEIRRVLPQKWTGLPNHTHHTHILSHRTKLIKKHPQIYTQRERERARERERERERERDWSNPTETQTLTKKEWALYYEHPLIFVLSRIAESWVSSLSLSLYLSIYLSKTIYI